MKAFKHIAGLGLVGLALTVSGDALALSCDEIMNMVNVNVPTNIVVQTMEDSGEQFTNDEIKCLISAGAPDDVVTTAKKMSAAAAEPDPVERGELETERRGGSEDNFDTTDRIGDDGGRGGRGGRGGYEDLPEEGAETSGQGVCANKVDDAIEAYKANKPLGASKMLFDLLEEGSCPDQTSRMHFYLARALYDLEMYHSSQYYFMQVVKKGPANPYFKHALPKVVAIARYTGDDSELMRVVPHIPPEEYPRRAQNYLYYLMGVRLYEKDELSEARRYFGQISTKSDVYLKSKYFEGVIYNKQGRLKSAVRSFRDVITDADKVDLYTEDELREVERLTDLSLVNVARIYYSIERYDEANTYYSLVPRESEFWPQSLFESAWANFMLNDLNTTLGQILTVQSPFYDDEEFIPEAQILRALTFFNLCEYSQVERELLQFEGEVRPMHTELTDFVKQYNSKEGRKLADQAFDAYFGGVQKDTVLPKSMFKRFLRNQDLYSLVRHLQLMDEEERKIEAQKALWRDSVGVHLKDVIEKDRRRYKQRAGLVMLKEMAVMANYLGDLLTQSEIIRFEVVSAKRGELEYKITNLDLADTQATAQVDFATSVDFIYWPFNGEFWEDELGYYYYAEQGKCD
jgi:tetratricopeptide (TPR) repeat protein